MEFYDDAFVEDFLGLGGSYANGGAAAAASHSRKTGFETVDPHYHKMKTNVPKYNSKGVQKGYETVECYSTPHGDSRIRDAISGEYTRYVVGSKAQSLFFKVIVAMGESPRGPIHLYYYTPEMYERHQKCQISEESKENWRARQEQIREELGL